MPTGTPKAGGQTGASQELHAGAASPATKMAQPSAQKTAATTHAAANKKPQKAPATAKPVAAKDLVNANVRVLQDWPAGAGNSAWVTIDKSGAVVGFRAGPDGLLPEGGAAVQVYRTVDEGVAVFGFGNYRNLTPIQRNSIEQTWKALREIRDAVWKVRPR